MSAKTGRFKVDVFDCNVHIIVAKEVMRSLNWHFKKHGHLPQDFAVSGMCTRLPEDRIGNYYLFFDLDDLSTDIVNHEKSHLLDYILKDRDIKPVDEIRAYLDGFLSHKIEKFFKSRKLKVKNKR